MKRALASLAVVLAVVAFMIVAGGSGSSSGNPTFRVELDNAFGLIPGADFKVVGVKAGTIKSVDLCGMVKGAHCQDPRNALVTVQVTQSGFGSFHSDAFCESRPQSLIGEYYLQCQPGSTGPALRSGATIPVTHTQSTIPVDFLNDVMRLPYRERFTLIINELGAAVGALRRPRGRPAPRGPGARRDRQPPEPAGQGLEDDQPAERQRGHRHNRAGQQLKAGPELHRAGQQRGRRNGYPAAESGRHVA
jgi:hypothetical protein